ncbi:hypothetical protein T265_11790 [Opisthorchis viverrini]|uniref:Uncharacterized protein n=1 Tax=Opisthorchis viverrini TaxID=6198 RepID=A0A074Z877_OPIVI|nr:hypothetical protein T265_11790 [Opisthorchis viverrini]KER19440.1 hypothetical protein T265_11790 [Opisthorchis viverrini]
MFGDADSQRLPMVVSARHLKKSEQYKDVRETVKMNLTLTHVTNVYYSDLQLMEANTMNECYCGINDSLMVNTGRK